MSSFLELHNQEEELVNNNNNNDFLCANILKDRALWCDQTKGLTNLLIVQQLRESSTDK